MLNLLAATAIVAISLFPKEWSYEEMLQHEFGHINCPWWQHGENDTSAIIPPRQCQGRPKGRVILLRPEPWMMGKYCRYSNGKSAEACVVEMW
jgi:hypothetical protein